MKTLADLLEWWIGAISPGTACHDRSVSAVGTIVATMAAGTALDDLGPAHIRRLLLELERGGNGAHTVNNKRSIIQRAWNAARDFGYVDGDNPVDSVKKRKAPKYTPESLPPWDILKIIEAAPSDTWRRLFAAAAYTGMRRGELYALRKRDVDLERGLLFVRRSYDREVTKTGRQRILPIHPELMPYLEEALANEPGDLVFPNPHGEQWYPRTRASERVRNACKRAGVREIRFKDLRSSFASLLVQQGAPMEAARIFLGHSKTETTREHYAAFSEAEYLRAQLHRVSLMHPPRLHLRHREPEQIGLFQDSGQTPRPMPTNGQRVHTQGEKKTRPRAGKHRAGQTSKGR